MRFKWNKITVSNLGKHLSLLAITKGQVNDVKCIVLTLFIVTVSINWKV